MDWPEVVLLGLIISWGGLIIVMRIWSNAVRDMADVATNIVKELEDLDG